MSFAYTLFLPGFFSALSVDIQFNTSQVVHQDFLYFQGPFSIQFYEWPFF